MRKNKIPNRRARQKIKTLFLLIAIFFVSISILFAFYLFLYPKNTTLVSPIERITQQNAKVIPPDDGTKNIQNLLEKNNIAVSDISAASGSGLLVTLKDGQQVFFSLQKNVDQQIASLQLIIRQLTIEGRRFNRVDFRFDNPVVTF